MALVSRDPFARVELHKKQITVSRADDTCRWCGNQKVIYQRRKPRSVLFEFWRESDCGRIYPASGRYCCVSCFRSYWS